MKSLSCVWLLATQWTAAHLTHLSMGFSKQEYWSGLPCPSPGDHPNPGIKPRSPTSCQNNQPSVLLWDLWKGEGLEIASVANGQGFKHHAYVMKLSKKKKKKQKPATTTSKPKEWGPENLGVGTHMEMCGEGHTWNGQGSSTRLPSYLPYALLLSGYFWVVSLYNKPINYYAKCFSDVCYPL